MMSIHFHVALISITILLLYKCSLFLEWHLLLYIGDPYLFEQKKELELEEAECNQVISGKPYHSLKNYMLLDPTGHLPFNNHNNSCMPKYNIGEYILYLILKNIKLQDEVVC
ncbi:hypothetical protein SAY86_027523 [Trapa natans]|uniref:Uncharacterized protein n=1 Tax=Trapa natans TaxID=22666 RepID=A0AAN7KRK5_TRANT|nr:hypothetical protein SAY86_027523 [Trapa natans]